MIDLADNCKISPGYRSDHSIVQFDISFSRFQMGRGVWNFKNSLSENQEYLTLINKVIMQEKIKYAVPFYTLDYLQTTSSSGYIQLVIDDDLFLELLYFKIRGETEKFSSTLKKMVQVKENDLKQNIAFLEATETLTL